MMDDGGLPLGAQSQVNNDDDEHQHFQQVIQSYQQYATFHQTRQRGINRRLHNLLRSESRSSGTKVSNDDDASTADAAAAANPQYHHPTLQSILPPSLLIQPSSTSIATASDEYHTYQKEFSAATIRNQFVLDNVLQYSNQETSQDVLRRWRLQQQHQLQQHPQHECTNNCKDDNDGTIEVNHIGSTSTEWTTEDRISKIDSVLKSMARDWSIEGYEERSVVYNRMIMALERYLPLRSGSSSTIDDATTDRTTNATSSLTTRTPHRVAVPGSGLGRLAWEIYSRGYSVQGSDFSLPMLLASDFILNGCGSGGGRDGACGGSDSFQQFRISPWLAETKNVSSFRDRIRTVVVPDVDPTAIDHSSIIDDECSCCDGLPEFTMLAGEFLHLYAHHLPEYECTSTT